MATGRNLHVDTPLSNLFVAAFETQGDFVAAQLFPTVPVGKQSDRYYVLKKENWLKLHTTYRAPRTRANRIEFDISSGSFFCDNYALGAEIALEDLANADTALSIRQSNIALVTRGLLADWENRAAVIATTSGNHVAAPVRNTSGPAAWDSVLSADLIEQLGAGHDAIFASTGLRANTLVLDYQSYMYAKRNQRLASRFQYRNNGPVHVSDPQMLESFMVDKLLIARSQKNTANLPAGSTTSIWGPTALLCRTEPGLSLMTATYGLSMRWTAPELGIPLAVTTDVEDGAGKRKIEILEAGLYQDEKIIASDLGYFINTKSGTPW